MKFALILTLVSLAFSPAEANDSNAPFQCEGHYSNDKINLREKLIFNEVTYPIKNAWMVIAKTSDGRYQVNVNYNAAAEYGAYQLFKGTDKPVTTVMMSGSLVFPLPKAKQNAWVTYQDIGVGSNSEFVTFSCKLK